jgi:hypothetical protein
MDLFGVLFLSYAAYYVEFELFTASLLLIISSAVVHKLLKRNVYPILYIGRIVGSFFIFGSLFAVYDVIIFGVGDFATMGTLLMALLSGLALFLLSWKKLQKKRASEYA